MPKRADPKNELRISRMGKKAIEQGLVRVVGRDERGRCFLVVLASDADRAAIFDCGPGTLSVFDARQEFNYQSWQPAGEGDVL